MEETIREWVVVRVKEEAQQIRLSHTDEIRSKKCSIYKLDDRVTRSNKEAYLPQWVSFGPYHYWDEHLLPMTKHKHRAFLYTLKRSNQDPECFVQAVEDIRDELLDSYESIDPFWRANRDEFVKLMIVDGCFMLEISRKESYGMDYPPNDPIFGKHGDHHVLPYIRCDMIKLENQLPYLLLTKLAQVGKHDLKYVYDLVHNFSSTKYVAIPPVPIDGCFHMVHLYKRLMCWPSHAKIPFRRELLSRNFRYSGSATENDQAGITFQSSQTEDISAVSFSDGIIKLPYLVLQETSESVLLNILAFEQLHVGEGSQVSSYIRFMSSLIKDDKDASLLRSKGIIRNTIGNDTDTVQLFKSLTKDMSFDPLCDMYTEVTSKMFRYRLQRWPWFRSSLIDTYIREWPVLSASAAAFLFILTTIQTIYTVYSSYSK